MRPNLFIEVWLSAALGFDAAGAGAQIYGAGQNRISCISYKDVAQFAVLSLSTPEVRNTTIKLGAPEALSPLQVVRVFEEVSGKMFTIHRVPEAALLAQKAAASDPLQESFAALMLLYARGEVIDIEETLRTFPVQLCSVREYASAQVAA